MLTQTLDQQYLAHTYNRFPLEIVGGKGSLLRGADGREYIDLGSGIGVNIFGMDDDEWRDAVTAQLGRFQHVSNLYYSEPAAKLAQMLCERTGLKRVFFSNSGAESNECAIKAARKWAAEHKGPEYCSIITLRGSFHGRTLGTLAATGQDVFHRDYQPLPGGFLYAQPGECEALERLAAEHPCAAILFEAVQGEGGVRPIGQEFASGRTLGTLAATGQDVFHRDYQPLPGGFLYAQPGECEALERLAAEHPCAAILFEAVQGEGGVRPIGQEFASCLQEVCRRHDLLLMADEVQLGNGRSGSLYGYMNYGLQPDVVSTAKGIGGGLPLGVTMFGERVADVFHPGDHGTTFGGNPVCCAGAVNILSRIDDRLLEGVRERSDYLRRTLQAAPGIRSVTGMGLMLGLEIDIPAREFAERALREGVLVTTAKQKIRLLPALNIPMELLKTAAQALVHCAAE